jgi:hypothetical protein
MPDNQAAQKQWLADMASGNRGSGKIDMGPEVLASKVGQARPTRGKSAGPRVPPPSKAFARKL